MADSMCAFSSGWNLSVFDVMPCQCEPACSAEHIRPPKVFFPVQHLPGFPALDWDRSGKQAEDKETSSSTLLNRLEGLDMLIWAEGATVYIGKDKVNTS